MKTMTFKQLRQQIGEAHGDKNNRGWRKNQKPTVKKKNKVQEDEDEPEVDTELEVAGDADDEQVMIVTFKTTDKALVDILQSDAGINGITISTTDDVQTFGPDSFDDIEVNDWSEDDVEDDDEDDEQVPLSENEIFDESDKIVVHCYDIEWDTDGEDPTELDLPKECEIEVSAKDFEEDPDETVGDALSDKYGYCLYGFGCKEIDDVEDGE